MGAGASHNYASVREARDAGIPQHEIDAWLAANDWDISGSRNSWSPPPSPADTPEQAWRKSMDIDG